MEELDFSHFKIAFVGLGLIGASYAMAVKNLNFLEIMGIDEDGKTVKKALESNIIDRGSRNAADILKGADIVVTALYPEETVDFIKNNIKNFKEGVLITDTCGVKAPVMDKVFSFLPETMDFIGGHPMSGKETKGISSAEPGLFKNTNYIITPVEKNKKENVDFISGIARGIGCKKVISISPEEHDRIISYTSQLPHVLAISLVNSADFGDCTALLTGGSYKDTTRIAAINHMLWTQLLTLNSENLIATIEKFEENIRIIKKAIAEGNESMVKNILERASENKRMMSNERT